MKRALRATDAEVGSGAKARGEVERFLECRSPRNVQVAGEFAIMVQVTELRMSAGSASFRMPEIAAEGSPLYVLLDAPPGCEVISNAIVKISLPPRGDSDQAWFFIRAPRTPGSYRFAVTVLWAGVGSHVLACQPVVVTVSSRATDPMSVLKGPTRHATSGQGGAALTVIRSSPRTYQYVLYRAGHSPVHDVLTMTADPRSQLRVLTSDLNQMARGGAGWRPAGMRDELRARGVDLWRDFLPGKIGEALCGLRPGEDTLTVSCQNSTLGVPWELLYPLDSIAGCSDFLVQLFNVVRSPDSTAAWCRSFALQPAVIVLPDDQVPGAAEEARAITEMLGPVAGGRRYVREKARLQQDLRSMPFGLLHVAAHDRDGAGTISMAARQRFSPSDLNVFAGDGGHWSGRRPLVFVNACGTAGTRQRFTQFTSWAQSFFEAGAGGFIGSMWDVRSVTASAFAQRFYQASYVDGLPFGKALREAREHSRSLSPDPTWLAYAAHGDPAATAAREHE